MSVSENLDAKAKIYFCGSIRGGRQDAELYRRIIAQLLKYGEVLTEHPVGTGTDADSSITDKEIHDRDVSDIEAADYVIAEVTQPSLGVGYEIGRAVTLEKPILCLFRPSEGKRLSAMIRGAENGRNIKIFDYTEKDLVNIFKNFFSSKE